MIFGGRRPGVEDEYEILAELIPIAKSMYVQYQAVSQRSGIRKDQKVTNFTVDTPVPYRLADLLSLINERMGKLENRSSRMKYFKLIARIETLSNDPRYNFIFENANVGGDTAVCTPPNTEVSLTRLPRRIASIAASVEPLTQRLQRPHHLGAAASDGDICRSARRGPAAAPV